LFPTFGTNHKPVRLQLFHPLRTDEFFEFVRNQKHGLFPPSPDIQKRYLGRRTLLDKEIKRTTLPAFLKVDALLQASSKPVLLWILN